MTAEGDDRAETERTRLLLVHDVESPVRNLAEPVPPAERAAGEDASSASRKRAPRIDLSKLEADRFPARVPQVAITDGRRVAAYTTTTNPATRVRTAPRTASILVDGPLEVPPELDLRIETTLPESETRASATPPIDSPIGELQSEAASREAPTFPTRALRGPRDVDTVPDAPVALRMSSASSPAPGAAPIASTAPFRSQWDVVTIPGEVAITRRRRARRIAYWAIGGVAVPLLGLSIVKMMSTPPDTEPVTTGEHVAIQTPVAPTAATIASVTAAPSVTAPPPPASASGVPRESASARAPIEPRKPPVRARAPEGKSPPSTMIDRELR